MITKITHNWNIKNDYPILDKDQKQHEDKRESDYIWNQEEYILKVNGVWFKDFCLEIGTPREEAHKYHLSELSNVFKYLRNFGIYRDNIEIYHYCPVARLDVSTAEHYHPTDNQAKRYIVQYEDGMVYNSMFDSCYHWQIATQVTFDEALKMALGHMAMATYIDSYLEAWILVMDWVEDPMSYDL